MNAINVVEKVWDDFFKNDKKITEKKVNDIIAILWENGLIDFANINDFIAASKFDEDFWINVAEFHFEEIEDMINDKEDFMMWMNKQRERNGFVFALINMIE